METCLFRQWSVTKRNGRPAGHGPAGRPFVYIYFMYSLSPVSYTHLDVYKRQTEDGGYTAECVVTVGKKEVPATGISLDKTSVELEKGKAIVLRATVTPANATNKRVIWLSSDEDVIAVDTTGIVEGLEEGEADVIAVTSDGKHEAVSYTHLVTLSQSELSLSVGSYKRLEYTVFPTNATNQTVSWSSSDPVSYTHLDVYKRQGESDGRLSTG